MEDTSRFTKYFSFMPLVEAIINFKTKHRPEEATEADKQESMKIAEEVLQRFHHACYEGKFYTGGKKIWDIRKVGE